jgi:predicted LPLAT superfamily acyltransferase
MRQWTSKSIGMPWHYWFFYILIRLGGRHIAYFFMYFIVLWYLFFYPPLHTKCRPYLSRRFPDVDSRLIRLFYKYRWVTSLGKTLIDRAVYGILGSQSIEIDVPNKQTFVDLLGENKGLIIVSAHTGCWQIAFSALSFIPQKVNIVMYRDQMDIDKHYYEYQDQKAPFKVIDPGGYLGGTLEMAASLQEKEIVGMMEDRLFGSDTKTLTVDFLGNPIQIPVTPFRLASMAGTPIAVVFSRKNNRSGYIAEVFDVIRVPSAINRKSDAYEIYGRQYIQCLTRFVEQYPFEFYNFYDMWNYTMVTQ